MNPLRTTLSTLVLALAVVGSAQAKDDMDVARLNNSLDQLARERDHDHEDQRGGLHGSGVLQEDRLDAVGHTLDRVHRVLDRLDHVLGP